MVEVVVLAEPVRYLDALHKELKVMTSLLAGDVAKASHWDEPLITSGSRYGLVGPTGDQHEAIVRWHVY